MADFPAVWFCLMTNAATSPAGVRSDGRWRPVNALIIYDTVYGNTKQIAEAIASGLSEQYTVTLLAASDVQHIPEDLDLLVVGGPTHRHGLSDGMRDLLDRWPEATIYELLAAAFDTRYRGPGWLMGSAANRISRSLRHRGANLIVTPESFFVARHQPVEGGKRQHETEQLEEGEAERAESWASQLAAHLAPVA